MNDPSTGGPEVEPNILIPKTIGLLNVIFAVCLMACGMCYAFYGALLPTLATTIEAQQKELKAQQVAARKAEIDALKVQEAKAETEGDKATIRAQIDSISNEPPMPPIDLGLNKLGFDDPRVLGYFIVDPASGLILNLVMFVAGIGLLRSSEWGRKLGVWLAWTKIARLVLLSTWLLVGVRPVMHSRAAALVQELEKHPAADPSAMKPEAARALVEGVDRIILSFGIITLLVGVIYPTLSVALLTRPSARAACRPRRDGARLDEYR